MSAPDYEYRGLMAQGWDLLRGDTANWPDRAFYLEIIRRSGQPVLDVGCGTGRLLLDFMARGIDVDGVDNSPEMLALLREKARAAGLAPRTWEQPMESLAIPRRYRTVLVPSSSIQLVTDPESAAAALRGMHSLLEPGGMLAASFMTLWREGEPLESVHESSARRPSDGAILWRVARSRFEPASGCEHTEDVYELRIEDRVVAEETHRRSPAVRSYTQQDAVNLLEQAGFSDISVYGGFTFRPAEADNRLFCLAARRG